MAEYAAWAFIYAKRVKDKLKKAGATSKETAKTIEELNLSGPEKRRLEELVFLGQVKKTEGGLYYILGG